MIAYIAQRLLWGALVLFCSGSLVFVAARVLPGDVVLARMAGEGGSVDMREVERIRHELGLDRPLHIQYITSWGDLARGDMGISLWTGKPVAEELAVRIPVTLELALLALLFAVVTAIPIGMVSAIYRESWVDYLTRLISIGGISVPVFVVGTAVVIVPAVLFKYGGPLAFTPLLVNPAENLRQMIPAALVLGLALAGITMRMTRSAMLEVLRQDYVRTAHAKGLAARVVYLRHAFRNAVLPVITIVGTQFAHLLGGAVITEVIFTLPGVGRLTVDSLGNRDYTQLQGNLLFLATVYVAVNLLVDISYGSLDPRLQEGH